MRYDQHARLIVVLESNKMTLSLRQRGKEHVDFIIKKYDLDMTQGGAHFDKQ